MPIFEYECKKCKSRQEEIQESHKSDNPTCAICKVKMRRLVSLNSFQLKGGGWYKDGYQKKKD